MIEDALGMHDETLKHGSPITQPDSGMICYLIEDEMTSDYAREAMKWFLKFYTIEATRGIRISVNICAGNFVNPEYGRVPLPDRSFHFLRIFAIEDEWIAAVYNRSDTARIKDASAEAHEGEFINFTITKGDLIFRYSLEIGPWSSACLKKCYSDFR